MNLHINGSNHIYENISDYLKVFANTQGDKTAFIQVNRARGNTLIYDTYSYQSLYNQSLQIAHGLHQAGFKKGWKCIVMVKPGLDFLRLVFGLIKGGFIPVFIDPWIGLSNIKTCIEEIEPEAFVGIPKALIAQKSLGWGKSSIQKLISTGVISSKKVLTLKGIMKSGISNERALPVSSPDDISAIVFTSGSTGVPKGVVHRHAQMAAQVEILKEKYLIKSGEIHLPALPVFALLNLAMGVTTIYPHTDITQPAKVCLEAIQQTIQYFNVDTLFASPVLIDRLSRFGHKHSMSFPSLKRVVTGGAPASPSVLQHLNGILPPQANVFTPYGSTEVLPIASIESREILDYAQFQTHQGAGVCVGEPVKELEVHIIPIQDEPIPNWSQELSLPANQIGEIVVRGPIVTQSYYNREVSNLLTKIEPLESRDSLYHRMGDLGYFDQEGRLWFCGRKAHRVITAQETLYSVQCEGIFNSHFAVKRSALARVDFDGVVKAVICIELEKFVRPWQRKSLKLILLKKAQTFEVTKNITDLLFHPNFPVDIRHNSKIFREKLSVWAQKKLSKGRLT